MQKRRNEAENALRFSLRNNSVIHRVGRGNRSHCHPKATITEQMRNTLNLRINVVTSDELCVLRERECL